MDGGTEDKHADMAAEIAALRSKLDNEHRLANLLAEQLHVSADEKLALEARYKEAEAELLAHCGREASARIEAQTFAARARLRADKAESERDRYREALERIAAMATGHSSWLSALETAHAALNVDAG